MERPFCLVLSGMPNSGKSTIAYGLVQKRLRNTLIIDGDKHREMQFLGEQLGFSLEDILRNAEHVIKLAQFAMQQGFNVLVPQIAPYYEQRKLMKEKIPNCHVVYCRCSGEARQARPNFRDSELEYQAGGYDYRVDTDIYTVDQCVDSVLDYLDMGDDKLMQAMIEGDESQELREK